MGDRIMENIMEDLINHLTDLSDQYPAGEVKELLDALIVDCNAGVSRDNIMADAEAFQAYHPSSLVARAIARVKMALGQTQAS